MRDGIWHGFFLNMSQDAVIRGKKIQFYFMQDIDIITYDILLDMRYHKIS